MQLNFHISSSVYRTLTVLGVAVILVWSIGAGWSKGKSMADAGQVLANADRLVTGLDYFYNDQDRYPTALEFDSGLMHAYFTSFPPHNFTSSQCPESYSYKRNSASQYLLGFCLPVATNGFRQGWNSSTQGR